MFLLVKGQTSPSLLGYSAGIQPPSAGPQTPGPYSRAEGRREMGKQNMLKGIARDDVGYCTFYLGVIMKRLSNEVMFEQSPEK